MSYDLILTQHAQRPLNDAAIASLRQHVSASSVLSRCEVFATTDEERDSEGRDVLTACLPAGTDERAVERIFAELKQLAKAYGLRLHDPQVGEDVALDGDARLPEMY